MSSNVKIVFVVSLIVVMSGMLLAKSHQDVWVIEDFESYETSTGVKPLLADVVINWPPTGGPWWNSYSLQDILTYIGSGGQAGGVIGYYRAERPDLPLGILGASRAGAAITDEDMWQIIEFDLSAQMHGNDFSAKEVCSSVAAIVPGIEDKGADVTRNVTYAIDDIAFYKESECPQYLVGDVNGDCEVTLADVAIIAGEWGL